MDESIQDKIVDYRDLIKKSTEGFVGRKWVRDELDTFLENKKGKKNFLILGEPGCGKTAFVADLISRRYYPHHFIGRGGHIWIIAELDWRDPVRFAESVGYQLLRDYGGYVIDWSELTSGKIKIKVKQSVKKLEGRLVGSRLNRFMALPRHGRKDVELDIHQEVEEYSSAAKMIGVIIKKWVAEVEMIVRILIKTPLKRIGEKYPDSQFLVIVDGLDEAMDVVNKSRSILNMIPKLLPANVRFLFSSRPGRHLKTNFLDQCNILWLSQDESGEADPRAIQDVTRYVEQLANEDAVIKMLESHNLPLEDFIKKVVEASDANFLYLYNYARELREGDETLLDLNSLPKGLNGIYADFLAKIRGRLDESMWRKEYKTVLGTLAVAREPLTIDDISSFSEVLEDDVGATITDIKQFLDMRGEDVEDRKYKIYHRTFGEFILSKKNEDRVSAKNAHRKFVKQYSPGKRSWKEEYAIKYLMSHMISAESWIELGDLMSNIGYLEKKQAKKEQYRFQNDFVVLLRNSKISTGDLVKILEQTLNAIAEKLAVGKLKADWLDIFSYWINEFGQTEDEERWTALRKIAKKFDLACGAVSKELAVQHQQAGDYDWALRFAELCTWVYQRSEEFQKCEEACRFAEEMCRNRKMDEAYQLLGRTEFLRMQARALTKLSEIEKDENIKKEYEEEAHSIYQKLNEAIKFDENYEWQLSVEEWQQLEEDIGKLLTPPSADKKTEKVQIVSNSHDSISAIYIIQTLERYGMSVNWIHSSEFKIKDLALENVKFTILIGGPKSPASSEIYEKFFEANKDRYLDLYSAEGMVAETLSLTFGKTQCYMVGGPSKINTLKAAYDFTKNTNMLSLV